MVNNSIEKPFLKWVGGKSQIIDTVLQKFPREMNNYHEIFLGGGSVLLAVLSLEKQGLIKIKGKINACDINYSLIQVYKHIQSNHEELYKYISLYISEYDSIMMVLVNRKPNSIEEAKTSKESYYYWIRDKYNKIDKSLIESSALFMFLNKTCFRGLYREGPNGYNVPYGHYKKTPTIISKDDLNRISNLIKDVEFKVSGFSDSLKNIKKGDFVYLDPPYAPENNKSFVGYVADGFSIEMHNALFDTIKKIKDIKFVMSNAKVDLVLDNFQGYNCEEVIARRAINSKNPESKTT